MKALIELTNDTLPEGHPVFGLLRHVQEVLALPAPSLVGIGGRIRVVSKRLSQIAQA